MNPFIFFAVSVCVYFKEQTSAKQIKMVLKKDSLHSTIWDSRRKAARKHLDFLRRLDVDILFTNKPEGSSHVEKDESTEISVQAVYVVDFAGGSSW